MLGSCSKCPSLIISLLTYTGVSLLYWLWIWYFRRSGSLSEETEPRQDHSTSTIIIEKLLTNHLTTLSLLGSINESSPSWSQYPMEVLDTLGNPYSVINPVDCLLPKIATLYYLKLAYLSVFPFLLFSIYALVQLLRRNSRLNSSSFVTTLLIVIYLLQPSILRSLYRSLQ